LRHGEPKSERLATASGGGPNKDMVVLVVVYRSSVGTVYIVGFMEESQRFYEKLATANRFDERTEST
jgi:hypothetical protein